MMRFFLFTFFCGTISVFAGCLNDKHFITPNLLHPGHISEQRQRMEQFDPFGQPGFGPKIEGDRFPGADLPRPPAGRLQQNQKQFIVR